MIEQTRKCNMCKKEVFTKNQATITYDGVVLNPLILCRSCAYASSHGVGTKKEKEVSE